MGWQKSGGFWEWRSTDEGAADASGMAEATGEARTANALPNEAELEHLRGARDLVQDTVTSLEAA